jgi:uncharacterized protein (TIGR02271 family)
MNPTEASVVTGKDGLRGQIVQQAASNERQVLVQFEDGRRVLIPKEVLVQKENGSYYLPLSAVELERQYQQRQTGQTGQVNSQEPLVIPVIEEEVQVGKRRVDTGGVRVRKVVQEREEVIDEPLLREEVNVERIPINQMVAANGKVGMRQEGDTIIVPIVEEVLVVEKRLFVKEEVRITKRQTTVSQPQNVTLRGEEVIVEPINPQQPSPSTSVDGSGNYAM